MPDPLGSFIRLRWTGSGAWLERDTLERLRVNLVPMKPPEGAPTKGGCWVWVGPVLTTGRPVLYHKNDILSVPRLLWVLQNGPLSERETLKGLCGVGRCCNPDHRRIERTGPVTRRSLRPGQEWEYPRCKRGHVQTPENVYHYQGKTMCRDCRAANQRKYRAEVRDGVTPYSA